MKTVLFILLLLMLAMTGQSQQISVKSFRQLENDLDARASYPKEDKNGEKAAIIKIVTTETGFEFDGGIIGIVASVQKTSEIWLYVPRGSKVVTIKHPKLGLLRNYAYPQAIGAGEVYEMILISGRVVTTIEEPTIETQWLIITTDPAGADVYINNQPAGKTPYQNELPTGKYTWRVSKELYLPGAGIANLITGGEKQVMNLQLKPDFGTLNISSLPENGAGVSFNNMPTGKVTPCTIEMVKSGDLTLTLNRDMYETTTQRITLAAGETKQVAVTMNPTFAQVTVTSEPAADVYVNGQFKAKAVWQGRLNPGVYTFEAKLEKYTTATEKQTVIIGQPLNVKMSPTPKTGNLKIMTTPFDATIKIDGKDLGKTPLTLKNYLIGDYTVELSLTGYATTYQKVTIMEGQMAEINAMLQNGMQVYISSEPTGADLFIDDKSAGKTPYSGNLGFGSYKLRIESNGKKAEKDIQVSHGGTAFFSLAINTFEIGQNYGGGIIFYIDETGKHGLIAAPDDQSTNAKWGCFGTSISGTSKAIGTGQANTKLIVNRCREAGIASRICNDLSLGGYDDWFLPSNDELELMYAQKKVIGGFASGRYWSSSEYNSVGAELLIFGRGDHFPEVKKATYHVRAVRAF